MYLITGEIKYITIGKVIYELYIVSIFFFLLKLKIENL